MIGTSLTTEGDTGVVVVHGIDVNGNGMYDMAAAGPSPLDPALPLEATAPAACGAFTAMQMGAVPEGGAETGVGSTAGIEHLAALGVGAVALVGAAAAGAVAYHRRAADQV